MYNIFLQVQLLEVRSRIKKWLNLHQDYVIVTFLKRMLYVLQGKIPERYPIM